MRLLLFIVVLLISQIGISQVSDQNKMSYQAVIFDADGQIVQDGTVGVQVSILQGSSSGTAVYVERHQKLTNTNGLLTLEIGGGTVQAGTYGDIDWSTGPYFFKTETDPEGGTNYSLTGVNQMLSVPYALHAKTVEMESDPTFSSSVASNITAADTAKWSNKQDQLTAGANITISGNTISATASSGGGTSSNSFYLGQDTLGGIVYFLYYDSSNEPHGLIVNKSQQSNTKWLNDNSVINCNSSYDGWKNTLFMTNGDSPARDYVAQLNTNKDEGFSDWYIPAYFELFLLFHNGFFVDKTADDISCDGLNIGGISGSYYWCSTEDYLKARALNFKTGAMESKTKTEGHFVRAIRKF